MSLKKMRFLTIAALILVTHKSFADDFCAIPVDDNFPQQVLELLRSDLNFLAQIKGTAVTTPLYKQIFESSTINGDVYCNYLKKRVKGFEYALDSTPNETAIIGSNKLMFIAPAYSELPLLERLAVLIHEARHADRNSPPHSLCPTSMKLMDGTPSGLANMFACDFDPLGAYGIELIWYFNVVKSCTNCARVDNIEFNAVTFDLLSRMDNDQAKSVLTSDMDALPK